MLLLVPLIPMSLPNEIIGHIIEFLNYNDFKSFILVSKNFYELSRHITQYYKLNNYRSLRYSIESLHAFKTVYYAYDPDEFVLLDVIFDTACCDNHFDIVKLLISRIDENILMEKVNGQELYRNVELIKIFVSRGINIPKHTVVDDFDEFETIYYSVIHHASIHGNLEVIKYLVKNGCDLTDIDLAFRDGKDEVRLYLLEKGAKCDPPDFHDIYATIRKNEPVLMEHYLQNGFVENKNLWLEIACCCKELEIVELLIKYGAVSRIGIYSSIKKEHFSTIKILKQRNIHQTCYRDDMFEFVKNEEPNVIEYCIYRNARLSSAEFGNLIDFAWEKRYVWLVYHLFRYYSKSKDSETYVKLDIATTNAIKYKYTDLTDTLDMYDLLEDWVATSCIKLDIS